MPWTSAEPSTAPRLRPYRGGRELIRPEPRHCTGSPPVTLVPALKLDCLVHLPALGAAGSVDISVISVDIPTVSAPEYAVFTGRRFEPSAAELGVKGGGSEGCQRKDYISRDELVNGHLGISVWPDPVRGSGPRWWPASAMFAM